MSNVGASEGKPPSDSPPPSSMASGRQGRLNTASRFALGPQSPLDQQDPTFKPVLTAMRSVGTTKPKVTVRIQSGAL